MAVTRRLRYTLSRALRRPIPSWPYRLHGAPALSGVSTPHPPPPTHPSLARLSPVGPGATRRVRPLHPSSITRSSLRMCFCCYQTREAAADRARDSRPAAGTCGSCRFRSRSQAAGRSTDRRPCSMVLWWSTRWTRRRRRAARCPAGQGRCRAPHDPGMIGLRTQQRRRWSSHRRSTRRDNSRRTCTALLLSHRTWAEAPRPYPAAHAAP